MVSKPAFSVEVARRPVIHIKAITCRAELICQGTLEGKPPNESVITRAVGNSVGATLKRDRCHQAVQGVRFPCRDKIPARGPGQG